MRSSPILERVALALGASWLVFVAVVVALRLVYPYELEWLEGAMLHLVARVRAGEALYAEPTLEYTMHCYAPLYYWIAAAVQVVTGEGPFGPKLVSVAATAATLALMWRFVRHAGAGRPAAFLAIALYAATFERGDAYHDTVRVDPLFVLLLLATMHALCFAKGPRGALLAGAFCALAFFAKQSAVLVPLPMALICWLARDRRDALLFAAAAVVPSVLGMLVLDASTDGWASWFLFDEVASHAVDWQMVRGFWTHDIGKVVGIAFVGALWAGGVCLWRWRRRRPLLLAASAAVMVGVAYGSRLHTGGAENVVYPAYVAIALLAALTYDAARSPRGRVLAAAAAILQLALPLYELPARLGQRASFVDVLRVVPTSADRAAGESFVAALTALEGPVLVPFHGALATRAGKTAGGHPVAINDVLRSGDAAVVEPFRARVRERLASRHYRAIVLDATIDDPWLRATIAEFYEAKGTLPGSEGYRWINARATFPIEVWVPR